MIESFVKYFALIVCSFYIYSKLLNIRKPSKYIAWDLIFASVFSFLIYYVRLLCQPLVTPILIAVFLVYITMATKTELGLSITTTILSYGMSVTFYLISSLLAAVMFNFIGIVYLNDSRAILIYAAVIQLLLCGIPFRFRRLKSGMPFLRSKVGGSCGVVISSVLLCCFFIISNANNPNSIFFISPVVLVFLCGVSILFWWRNRLKKVYIERLKSDEIQSLREIIKQKDERIKYLEKHNDSLAKIIHKDNKLIPTMEMAVSQYLRSAEHENYAGIQLEGRMLLKQLKAISCERSGVLAEYQSENEKLPVTGVFAIDALIAYMLTRSREKGIKYEFMFFGSVKYMVENIISVSDLRTILADLIENAVIATKDCKRKEILVSLGIFEGHYGIEIFDSGISFEPETLIDFGRRKTTTHAETGGSGIGLMTVSEILNTYNASFIIDEFSESYNNYTKKVCVKFDHLNQYIVKLKTDKKVHMISGGDLIVNF